MPRYEHAETSSFWEIEKSPDGKSFTARWGKLGTDGRSKTKRYDDAYTCAADYEELVAEKLKLGYKVETPVQARLAFAIKANPALEATLCEAIEDPNRWSVYADWLQEVGDVRGEIIALARAGSPDEAKALAEANADVLWGDAWSVHSGDAFTGKTWLPGWQDAVRTPIEVAFAYTLDEHNFIESITMAGLDEEGHVANAIYAVLSAPIGRFTRSIELHVTHDERYSGASGAPSYDAVVAAIARARPTALRRLVIDSAGYQLSWTKTGNLGRLLAAAPHLVTLRIEMGEIDLGESLDLPKLESLHLETGGLGRENLQTIGKAKWPSLVELVLYLGTHRYGADATAADVEALLTPEFPKLEQLALCNSEIPGAIVRALAKSPLLARLKALDLSKGTMTDDDVRPLVESFGAFQHLEKLDLSENYLSPSTIESLSSACCEHQYYDEMVRERDQYGHEEWAKDATFRYTRVSE
jgi:uncharacterized protein (TIGR02996 family)